MDVERALISKLISTGQLEEAISRGVRQEFFVDEECQNIWRYLLDHKRRYGSPPSLRVVKDDRPDFQWEHVPDSLTLVIDRFVNKVKQRQADHEIFELAGAIQDPERSENIEAEFLEVGRKLSILFTPTRVSRFSEVDQRIRHYEERAAKDEPLGIQFGFPTLDAVTGGIQPHEFVTVVAFSGVGKTTLLWNLAFNFWMQGKTPLFISLEMEAATLLRKFDAMLAGLKYEDVKHLRLSKDQVEQWRDKAEAIRNATADIPVIDDLRNCTPDSILAETIRHAPDIVVVDYLSLMKSSSVSKGVAMWQQLTEITQDLKQNARTLHVPILAAAQANRLAAKEGPELDTVGYSISVVQDSDIIITIHSDEEMREQKMIEVRVKKNRDGKLPTFRSHWDHDAMRYGEQSTTEYMRDRFIREEKEQEESMELDSKELPAVPPKAPRKRPRPRPHGVRPRPSR